MDLTGETLVVNCFYNFIEASSSVFVLNLRRLRRTMVGGRIQTLNDGVCQAAGKTHVTVSGFPPAFTAFTTVLFPQRFVSFRSRLVPRRKHTEVATKSGQAPPLQKQKRPSATYATTRTDSVPAASARDSAKSIALMPGSVFISISLNSDDSSFRRYENSHKKIIYLLFIFDCRCSRHKKIPLFP